MPVNLHINVKLNNTQKHMAKGEHIRQALPGAMKDGVLYVLSTMPPYPPKPAESTYRRTGTLGRSVTSLQGQASGALSRVEPLGTATVGYVGTNVVYAPYVIDENRQAWMHRGRWWTLQSVVRKATPGVLRILRKSIMNYLGA